MLLFALFSRLTAAICATASFIVSNAPWKVLEYCAGLGDIHDIVIENMERQENGLHG